MNENWQPQVLAINDWLADATRQLVFAQIASARLDAELILAHTLRKNRSYLHAHPEEQLTERTIEIANARLSLRIERVPVAYIIGHKEFYGHQFSVTTATLIPRPESEALIELLKQVIPRNSSLLHEKPLRLIDVGTGSGNLGITAKLLYPELDVTLSDISRHALKIAEKNAKDLQVEVSILHSNLLADYPFAADIIIANLPYVDGEWERSPETEHEPASALFAAHGGKALIYELLFQTKVTLVNGGSLILEADPEQHPAIISQAKKYGLLVSGQEGYGILLEKIAK
ncbi:MAG: peptide chain release factor N(5)-glutamine methyltransferase [Candidatus Microsaccharimonas sossegonensis]|uniref:peptide chain release factor N(5)-glutamine methyltransferase n=1 Tax=Candidatus Microsaccharimonas sossegonensis TaxID=2506948 RepID=A0A4Q0AHH8_9BACT|nr:MAG: peptide chain release factor N(5)-glutamine methyltransferase [Candidatus Microsaccharimonas sossegonensis]